ncbi:MAG: helix-turn-helix domain-containing protein [Deltaproteobacteria bacterium]|jgi:transcriptional regulator with XRE-family HTH domain
MPLERRNEPIPGFTRRLKQAIGRSYPSTTACAEALGLKRETLWTWACGRSVPSRLDLVDTLSRGLGVSIDWLITGTERPARAFNGPTFGLRLRHVILDRYDSLSACWRVLDVRKHSGRAWVNDRAHPHLAYTRRLGVLCNVSLDWLLRGETWEATVAAHVESPERTARQFASRALQQMADRQTDREVARVLTRLARSAARRPRAKRVRGGEQLPLPLRVRA